MSSAKDYRQVADAIAESLVIMAAADQKIHVAEKKRLISAIKSVWTTNYGSIKVAMMTALREVKLAQDFDMDLESRLKKHALFLSKLFSDKEKNSFLGQVEYLMRADGAVTRDEYDLFMILKKNLIAPPGFFGSLKTTLKAWAGK